MKYTETKNIKKGIAVAFYSAAALLMIVFSILFLLSRNIIFPCLNGIIMLASLFAFKGRYRIYSVIFFSFFPSLFSINKAISPGFLLQPSFQKIISVIPSFVSINIGIYIIVVVIDYFVLKAEKKHDNNLNISYFLIFAIFLVLSMLINIKSISFSGAISAICFLSLPVCFAIDRRAEKDIWSLIFVLTISILISNLFCFIFIYVFQKYRFDFLEIFVSSGYVKELKIKGINNFRFPGLIGDSNHNALNIILATTLVILYSIKIKKKNHLLIVFSVIIQAFGLIGGSKTYIITAFLVGLIFAVWYLYKRKIIIRGISILLVAFALIAFISINIGFVSTSILRILNVDDRGGLLESLLTGRWSTWKNYLVEISRNPWSIAFGHGPSSNKLFEFHYHSVFIQLLWETGFIGSILFCIYFYNFYMKQYKNVEFIVLIPFLVCLFFGITLHILYDEVIYYCLFITSLLVVYYHKPHLICKRGFVIIDV